MPQPLEIRPAAELVNEKDCLERRNSSTLQVSTFAAQVSELRLLRVQDAKDSSASRDKMYIAIKDVRTEVTNIHEATRREMARGFRTSNAPSAASKAKSTRPDMLAPDDKELLRHAALEMLAAREGTAHLLPAIRRRLAAELDFRFSDDDLLAALAFQLDGGLVRFTFDPDGASKWWQATRAGVQRIERGPLGHVDPAPP